jgi:hypothetical protein
VNCLPQKFYIYNRDRAHEVEIDLAEDLDRKTRAHQVAVEHAPAQDHVIENQDAALTEILKSVLPQIEMIEIVGYEFMSI